MKKFRNARMSSFLSICEKVLASYNYSSGDIASFECTHICGVILGAAERCDLREYTEFLYAEVGGSPHCVIMVENTIVDFTYSQFDEKKSWPLVSRPNSKLMSLSGQTEPRSAETAVQMAEASGIHREMMDQIVRIYSSQE
jgi:hypothetical protein